MSVCRFPLVYVCLPVCLPACLFACLSVCLPVCLPACLSVCLSLFISLSPASVSFSYLLHSSPPPSPSPPLYPFLSIRVCLLESSLSPSLHSVSLPLSLFLSLSLLPLSLLPLFTRVCVLAASPVTGGLFLSGDDGGSGGRTL